MKRYRPILALFVAAGILMSLMAVLSVMAVSAEEANMIKNGDFSRGTASWSSWTQDTSVASFEVVKAGPDGSRCLKITNTAPVASSYYQFVNCKQGRKYIMTCDVKYENIGTEGRGVVLGLATYDGAGGSGNNIGEAMSASSFGTSDGWRTISFIFDVTNNPASINVGARLWFSTGTVYVDNIRLVELTDTPATSGTYDLTLSDTPNRHTVDALGCEWDPKLLLPVNQKYGVTEEDIEVIKQSMDALGLQAVRMMIQPDWFEKQNDNDDPAVADPAGFDFDNPEMQSVFAQLRVCEELGIRVTLTWWGAPAGHWLACENIGDWIGAPNDLDEMTENIAYLLGYIRNDLGYTCVKELILQNEPSYSFRVDGGAVDFDYYVQYYKTVQARLIADGMGDIVLVGADDSQHYGWYYNSVEALSEVCGKFNSHNYAWSYDLPYLDVLVQEFVSARTSISGNTPFYLGEFGDGSTTGAYQAASTDTYGRGLYIASVLVNAFKAGAAGASYWPLHDIYYYENTQGGDNGGLMSMGLMGFKQDGAWSYRPSYYAYGLLCNAIPYGSEVYDVTGDTNHYVDVVAVKTTEGRWSIIAVNRSDAAQSVNISAPAIGTVLQRSELTAATLPTDGSMVAPTATATPKDGVYSIDMPAESIVVLSSIGMSEEEMEIPSIEWEPPSETEDTSSSATVGGADAPAEGCSSAAGFGAALTLSAVAAAVTLTKKKEN